MQHILDVGWISSDNYWYVHVIENGNKPVILQLSVYSQTLGKDIFNLEKALTSKDSFHWGIMHTSLSFTFNYNGLRQRLVIDFRATEMPSVDSGVRGSWMTAAGEATIRSNSNLNIEASNALVISWSPPR